MSGIRNQPISVGLEWGGGYLTFPIPQPGVVVGCCFYLLPLKHKHVDHFFAALTVARIFIVFLTKDTSRKN